MFEFVVFGFVIFAVCGGGNMASELARGGRESY